MDAGMRAALETRDAATEAALDPILLEHRDMMYARASGACRSRSERRRRPANRAPWG